MTVKERLTQYVEDKGLSKSEFCRRIGVSSAFISSMRRSIQPDKIESIAFNFPDLNISWLLTGEGTMLKDKEVSKIINTVKNVKVSEEAWNVIKKQAESLASKDRQMEELIALLKKANAPKEDNAKCADVSGSDLVK